MASFPPNPDDSELWLPSGIFFNEVPSRLCSHRLDDLAQHFAALTLLKQDQNLSKLPLKVSPSVQRLRPPVQYGIANPLSQSQGRFTLSNGFKDGRGVYGCKTGSYRGGGSELLYEYQLLKPTKPQVDSFLHSRATVLQKQQNRLQNRLLPDKGSGSKMSGFVKVSGGTGVFHPRVSNTTISTNNATGDVKKKQGVRSRQEIQLTAQRSSIKRVGGDNEKFDYQLPPPEIGLPQDWTY
ncbi:hypothetical protein FNV43_RR16656 [Rhamnella rubrinervis]|uniref:Uncharacterized protein n=1 Tax=Rhamnella rubrinervis TaxID=2594499 RepID=A0A8K0GZ70_9ROSA|nr:hypothetical protein FNV43_RR16656 [Rhamnella rubrinervis]